jgi:lysophospholipid acyltransferase (LPLAT)-like uncharacterized protein
VTPASEPEAAAAPAYGARDRLQFAAAALLAEAFTRGVGRTLRFTISSQPGPIDEPAVRPAIFAFWHRCVLPAAYRFRDRNIAVMTSLSRDGEYIARVIERLGFRAVRGSSSRGGSLALRELQRHLEGGHSVAFTIDGPRGPVYVAKRGAVRLARSSGLPVYPFYVALERPRVLRSWDRFMIPRPFTRALVRVEMPVRVPADADEAEMERCQAELQAKLEGARDWAEANLPGSAPAELDSQRSRGDTERSG